MSRRTPYTLFPAGGSITFDPFTAPDYPTVSELTVINVTASNINTISPSPGDIVRLSASVTLTSGKTIDGWNGTEENPIILLGNGHTFYNKTLTINDCHFVKFFDLDDRNSTGNGIVITACSDCVFTNIQGLNANSNGVRVLGTVPSTNSNRRLRFFNVTAQGGTGDDFTLHAGNAAENNGSHFIIVGLTASGTAGDSGPDFTSGSKLILINTTSIKKFNLGHGFADFYLRNHEALSVTGNSILIKNTAGEIVFQECTGTGQIRLEDQGGTRGLDPEGVPSEVPNPDLGLYVTNVLKTRANTQTVDNGSAADGTTVVPITIDPIPTISWLSDFVI